MLLPLYCEVHSTCPEAISMRMPPNAMDVPCQLLPKEVIAPFNVFKQLTMKVGIAMHFTACIVIGDDDILRVSTRKMWSGSLTHLSASRLCGLSVCAGRGDRDVPHTDITYVQCNGVSTN